MRVEFRIIRSRPKKRSSNRYSQKRTTEEPSSRRAELKKVVFSWWPQARVLVVPVQAQARPRRASGLRFDGRVARKPGLPGKPEQRGLASFRASG